MSRPRILHVNKFYAPFVGGVERVVRDIAEGLATEYDTRVLCCSHRGPFRREMRTGVEVFRAATPAVAFSMPLSLQFGSLFRSLTRSADLIHVHIPFPLADLIALLDGLPRKRVVISYHSDIVRQRWAMPVYGPVLRRFLRRADRVLAASERIRRHSPFLRDLGERCAVIPYGVTSQEHQPVSFDPRLPDGDFVLFVGRLVPYKGVEYLIRAMVGNPLPLVIVGKGPLLHSLERLAGELGISSRLHFLGAPPEAVIRGCFQRCKLFVLPSVQESEAFGLVQLEAMAYGKPVVNTDLPTGVPEVSVDDLTGITVPPRNVKALSDAILKILWDKELYTRYSANARRRASERSMECFIGGIRQLYADLFRVGTS